MVILTLRREAYLPDGTLGVLEVQGRKFPTLENRKDATDRHDACLPPGAYRLTPTQRAGGDKCYAISSPLLGVWERPSEVPKHVTDARSAVFLAAGFTLDDLVGSHVAIGKDRTRTREGWLLQMSRDAVNEVRTLIGSAFEVVLMVESPER
jgi:hypothetical protein